MKASGTATATIRSIRIDRLLVFLRLARTRSAALALIEAHALRLNRKHVLRGAEPARIGDVLTIALGQHIRVIEILSIPHRRGPPAEARSHYREVDADGLDRKTQITLAASPPGAADLPADPEDRF